MIDPADIATLSDPNALTGDQQNALARILAALLTTPAQGRPFTMSPGEVRQAIRMAERQAGTDEVLNYEHPLLQDPVVSCASKQQLIDNLRHRFGFSAIDANKF